MFFASRLGRRALPTAMLIAAALAAPALAVPAAVTLRVEGDSSLELALHPVGPEVHLALFFWEVERGVEGLRACRDLIPTMPAELGSSGRKESDCAAPSTCSWRKDASRSCGR